MGTIYLIEVKLNGINKSVNVIEYSDNLIFPTYDIPFIKKRGYYKDEYFKYPLCFDCETSHNHNEDNPIGWVYQWCIGWKDNNYYCGRTPSQFMNFLKQITKFYCSKDNQYIVIYVHNLSYDITYLIDWLKSEFINVEISAIKSHKIMSVKMPHIIFKCSYLLSNRSLEGFAKYVNSPVHKVIGGIDYNAIRYQDSVLNYDDWYYQVNDVATMIYSIDNIMTMYNDNITTIPFTNTGYVRRDCRNKARSDNKNHDNFIKTKLDSDTYKLCRKEFRGALSGGNYKFENKHIIENIGHYDFKSHYPSRQQLNYFPISKFVLYFDSTKNKQLSISKIVDICKQYCCLIDITIENLRLNDNVTCIYESTSRIITNKIGKCLYEEYNGRIMNFIGYTRIIINEIDLFWILKQYKIKSYYVNKIYVAEKGRIPQFIRDTVNEYFTIKETLENGIERMKSKNNLNGIYGMTATDIVRNTYNYNFENGEWDVSKAITDDDIQQELNKYYKSRNSFLPYQFGCWTTAHARNELMHIIVDIIGYDNIIYWDTDSAFFIENEDIIKRIGEYNNNIITLNKKLNLGIKNLKGTMSYYGTFEDEKENITEFKFLHSKCYAYVSNNELKATIAGVPAQKLIEVKNNKPIYYTREEELKTIDNLESGFIFSICGGTKSKYLHNDITTSVINEHITEYASSCIISETTKELSTADIPEPFTFCDWETE